MKEALIEFLKPPSMENFSIYNDGSHSENFNKLFPEGFVVVNYFPKYIAQSRLEKYDARLIANALLHHDIEIDKLSPTAKQEIKTAIDKLLELIK